MNDGHLNNPERIHKRENNWYEDSVLRYMNNSIIIKDYRLERNKAELRGLIEYGKVLTAQLEEQKEATFKRIQEFKTKNQNLKWYNKIFN